MPDYAALEAGLAARQMARALPADLVEEVRSTPLLSSRWERGRVMEWLRQQSPADRLDILNMLREWRARDEAEAAPLDDLWTSFGCETDRGMARLWWEAGDSLDLIAARLGFVYAAEVTVSMIAHWPAEGRWPAQVAS